MGKKNRFLALLCAITKIFVTLRVMKCDQSCTLRNFDLLFLQILKLEKHIVFVGSLIYSPFSLVYIFIHSCGMSERRHWFADIMAITRPPRLVYFYLP